MAKYNLNEVLKAKALEDQKKSEAEAGKPLALDDVSRVKVQSPGAQVFKRFIRNRLAVFGTCILILMFLFSFLGPVFYPYGQKDIFYTFNNEVVNYSLAKENTAYNGYVVNPDITASRTAVNMMNSNIKTMIETGRDKMLYVDKGDAYVIDNLGTEIYTLSPATSTEICSAGLNSVKLGVLDSIKKTIKYESGEEEIPGLDAAAAKACKTATEFDFGGNTYTLEKGQGKSYNVFTEREGFAYTGSPMSSAFESAVMKAIKNGEEEVTVGGKTYLFDTQEDTSVVYEISDSKIYSVYTRYIVDAYETGKELSSDFKAQALMAAYGSGKFTADGEYSIEPIDGGLMVTDANGDEYAEFSLFPVRRYDGGDTMDFDLKKRIAAEIISMRESGAKSASITYRLPQQQEDGSYYYVDGELQYSDSELVISQRDTGEYVVTCEQILYVIDRYAAPSSKHILGTDGDGFDEFARIMYGGRVSLMVGFVVVFLETFLGVIMGGIAGYYGGWVDNLIMRLVDVFYCLPSMPIMIILGAMMDALRMNTYVRLLIMMAALGIMGWAGVARLVRGQILSLREQEFMVAAEATGIKVKDRIFHHLVPNVMPQLIVTATMGMGGVIITESTLSFLGLGVKHPLATWGTIINSVSSASAMAHYAFIWIPVGLLICLTVIAFNFVGDGLRDAYDPKGKR